MARLVSIIRAFANGVEAFQSAIRPPVGQPMPPALVQTIPQDESEDLFARATFTSDGPLTVENPYLDSFDALRLQEILDNSLSTFQCLANASMYDCFQAVRDVNLASVTILTREADPQLTREQMDKGLLFEIARLAHYQFHEDTDADQMWAREEDLQYHINNVSLPIGAEVHAFLAASLSGELERAVRVGDAMVLQAIEVHGVMGNREVAESLARRNFAAFLIMEMAGTLSAQTMADVVRTEGRPIHQTLAEDTDDLGTDDE